MRVIPTPPSTWVAGPLPPQQLNVDEYSSDGTGFGATGALFHANRPVLFETITNSKQLTASATGTWNASGGSPTTAFQSCLDTSALFGLGADNPGVYATYTFGANVTGGAGSAGESRRLVPGRCLPDSRSGSRDSRHGRLRDLPRAGLPVI